MNDETTSRGGALLHACLLLVSAFALIAGIGFLYWLGSVEDRAKQHAHEDHGWDAPVWRPNDPGVVRPLEDDNWYIGDD